MKTDYQLDENIRPQDDLYHHVNNIWQKANPIPDNENKWGTFYVLREKAWKEVHTLADRIVAKESPTKAEKRIHDFFTAGYNYDQNKATNMTSLELLETDTSRLPAAKRLAKLHTLEVDAFWALHVDLDEKNSNMQVLRLSQSGLTLPNRDYYLDDDKKMKSIRDEFQQLFEALQPHLRSFQDISFSDILSLETELARISKTNAQLRDVEGNYTKVFVNELRDKIGQFEWSSYLKDLNLENLDYVIVDQPEFMSHVINLLETQDARLEAYLKWHTVLPFVSKVSEELSDIVFDFFGKVLSGTKTKQPLWKRLVLQADNIIGEDIGRLYVAEHFPESSKQEVLDLVEEIRTVYAKRIKELSWMETSTKDKALKKLTHMKVFIGYPDTWRDYSQLELSQTDHLQNIIEGTLHESRYHLSKVGNPPPLEMWHMTPQTVNAYHDPNRLEIVFPAAILQAPFFDPDASAVANLAGIGSVIGHELTHGFDDMGAKYDYKGNVDPWMSDAERKKFIKLSQPIRKRADAFEVVEGTTMIGDLVIGEAMADLGGAELAYEALQNRMTDNNSSDEDRNQQIKEFFYALAVLERGAIRPEAAVQYAKIDPHPDNRFRVNGTVQHMDSFYDAFEVDTNDKLYIRPTERAKIW